jgi:two-component sensor histidine kinase
LKRLIRSPTATTRNRSSGEQDHPRAGALRARLIAVVALALSPLLVLSAVQAVLEYGDDTLTRRDRLAASVYRAVDRGAKVVEGARPLLEAINAQSGIIAGGPRCSDVLRTALLGTREYRDFIRFDADGRLACSAVRTAQEGEGAAPLGPWFDELLDGADFAVSTVDGGAPGEEILFAAIARRTPTGAFDGALAAVINVAEPAQFIELDLLPAGSSMALVGSTGKVISAQRDFPDTEVPTALLDRALVDRDGLLLTDDWTRKGSEMLVAPLVGDDLFVLLATPNPSLLSWARVDLVGTVLLPLVMWLIALAAVALASDRLVLQWLEYLGRIARLYGGGHFDVEPVRAVHAPTEIATLASTMQTMATDIKARESELQESADQMAALIKEMHHRIKNNLQIIISLLNIQLSNTKNEGTVAALQEIRARINALALVHRSLYEAEDLRLVQLKPFFTDLLDQLALASGAGRFHIDLDAAIDSVELKPDEAVPLALFVTEAVINAFAHAFAGRDGGRIRVGIARRDGLLRLDVEDDGIGLEAGESSRPGVGSALMSAFARQLSAKTDLGKSELGGARVSLEFPLAAGGA